MRLPIRSAKLFSQQAYATDRRSIWSRRRPGAKSHSSPSKSRRFVTETGYSDGRHPDHVVFQFCGKGCPTAGLHHQRHVLRSQSSNCVIDYVGGEAGSRANRTIRMHWQPAGKICRRSFAHAAGRIRFAADVRTLSNRSQNARPPCQQNAKHITAGQRRADCERDATNAVARKMSVEALGVFRCYRWIAANTCCLNSKDCTIDEPGAEAARPTRNLMRKFGME